MKFVVRDHRQRTKLTLSADTSEHCSTSITLSLSGARVIEISNRLCAKYAESIAAYVKAGALKPCA